MRSRIAIPSGFNYLLALARLRRPWAIWEENESYSSGTPCGVERSGQIQNSD